MSHKPQLRVQSGVARNHILHYTKPNSRPISARERYELGNRKKDEELRKFNELKETAEELKKKEFQTVVYNSLSHKNTRSTETELKEKEKKENIMKRKERLRELLKNDEEVYKATKKKLSYPSPQTKRSSQVAIYPEVESLRLQLDNLKKKNAEDREKMVQQLSSSSFVKNYQPSRIFF